MRCKVAETDDEIASCFPVMVQLRPHLTESEFIARVRRMETTGYHLAYLATDTGVKVVAGFRILDLFVLGRVLYVDDLVTDAANRSQGYGDAIFDWLLVQAKERECGHLELDSGVHRGDAHRFYFRKRMKIICYHFSLPLALE